MIVVGRELWYFGLLGIVLGVHLVVRGNTVLSVVMGVMCIFGAVAHVVLVPQPWAFSIPIVLFGIYLVVGDGGLARLFGAAHRAR